MTEIDTPKICCGSIHLLEKADFMYNDLALWIGDVFRFYLSIQGGK